MPLSSLTGIPLIAEGSEATPGLWNSRFQIISSNIDQINNLAVGATSGLIFNGTGSPEGVITANPGFIYEDLTEPSGGTHRLWVKGTGSGNTGWLPNAGFAGTGARSLKGGFNSSAAGENAVAWGPGAVADQNQTSAFGYQARASLAGGSAFGAGSQAKDMNASAFGVNSTATLNGGAFGSNINSTATGAFTVGYLGTNSGFSSLLMTSRGTSLTDADTCLLDYDTVVVPSKFSSNGTVFVGPGVGKINATIQISGSDSSFTVVGVSIGLAYLRDRTHGGGAVVAWDRFLSASPTIIAAVGSGSSFTFGAPNATQIKLAALGSPSRLEAIGGSSRTSFQLDFVGQFLQ